MAIKLIKNEADYDSAMERIDILMDAKIDTPEGDELDMQTTLVEAYEVKHHPIDPPEPVESIELARQLKGSDPLNCFSGME